MKKLLTFLVILTFFSADSASIFTIVSWNIRDFGSSKSAAEIEIMANQLRNYDLVAIQEVVNGKGAGARAVAKLADILNRKGAKWDYKVSNGTSGDNPYKIERYAYLWKTSKVKLVGQPFLDKTYQAEIEREPYIAQFKIGDKMIRLFNYHAVSKKDNPPSEITHFKNYPAKYPGETLVFLGDFNTPQSNNVFNPLKKKGYQPALVNQKTTLKQKRLDNGDFLASEYDNIFYDSNKMTMTSSGIKDFTTQFPTLKEARTISDHVPIYMKFQWKN